MEIGMKHLKVYSESDLKLMNQEQDLNEAPAGKTVY